MELAQEANQLLHFFLAHSPGHQFLFLSEPFFHEMLMFMGPFRQAHHLDPPIRLVGEAFHKTLCFQPLHQPHHRGMGNLQLFLNLLLGHLSTGLGQVPKQVGLGPGKVALPHIHVRMGSHLEGNLLNQHADFVPIAFAFLHFFSFCWYGFHPRGRLPGGTPAQWQGLQLPGLGLRPPGWDLLKCVACYM